MLLIWKTRNVIHLLDPLKSFSQLGLQCELSVSCSNRNSFSLLNRERKRREPSYTGLFSCISDQYEITELLFPLLHKSWYNFLFRIPSIKILPPSSIIEKISI